MENKTTIIEIPMGVDVNNLIQEVENCNCIVVREDDFAKLGPYERRELLCRVTGKNINMSSEQLIKYISESII